MALAGVGIKNVASRGRIGPSDNSPLGKQYGLYDAGIKQNAGNFDEIMQGYRNILSNPNQGINSNSTGNSLTYTPFQGKQYGAPVQGSYTPTNTDAISRLRSQSETGGYSTEDQANIRARGISPIRSIYANAQNNVDRQRSLSGGYSPNYNAVSAKMAREVSDTISNKTTDINAQLAEMIAKGKASGLTGYADATSHETDARNLFEQNQRNEINKTNQANIDETNQENMFNQKGVTDLNKFNQNRIDLLNSEAQKKQMAALEGMRGLYGTTPALANLFGDQASRAVGQQNSIQSGQNQQGLQLVSSLLSNKRNSLG